MKLILSFTTAFLLALTIYQNYKLNSTHHQKTQILQLEKDIKQLKDSLSRDYFLVEGFKPILIKNQNGNDYKLYLASQTTIPYQFQLKLNDKIFSPSKDSDSSSTICFNIDKKLFLNDSLEGTLIANKSDWFAVTWQFRLPK